MTREEILHLAALSRITLTEVEVDRFIKELSAILTYVGTVQLLAGETTADDSSPVLGDRYNIFRQDVVTNDADAHTDVLLAEMPDREGRYMKVKKILNIE